MFAYRNLTLKSTLFSDIPTDRESYLEKLDPDEFLVLDYVPSDYWRCESDIIHNLRSNSSFFSYITDSRIGEILTDLAEREYIVKEFVYTDSKKEIKIKEKDDDKPQAVIGISSR